MELNKLIGSIVRHALTTAGGYFVANGLATQEQSTAIIGGIVALVGVLLSVYHKRVK